MIKIAISATALVCMTMLAGCSGQSRMTRPPMGISSGINGLQQSQCNCGGIEPKREFRARRKAEAKAQRNKDGGR